MINQRYINQPENTHIMDDVEGDPGDPGGNHSGKPLGSAYYDILKLASVNEKLDEEKEKKDKLVKELKEKGTSEIKKLETFYQKDIKLYGGIMGPLSILDCIEKNLEKGKDVMVKTYGTNSSRKYVIYEKKHPEKGLLQKVTPNIF